MPEVETEQALQWEIATLRLRQRLLPMGLPALACLLLFSLLAVDFCGSTVGEWRRGERTLLGERQYVPSVEPDAEAFARVDLRLLHERLLPRWGLGLGWGRGSSAEKEAFEAAFAEASLDPNLAELLNELRDHARVDAARSSERIQYLSWAWNEYLRTMDAPWHMECNVQVGPGRNRIIIQTYEVQARTSVAVGEHEYPLLILERADHLNVDDAALGRTGVHDGVAQVLIDGVRQHAKMRVWPLLHDLSSHETYTDEQFAQAVSREARARIDAESYAVLARTAPSFRALVMMRESILARRECGSRMQMGRPPAKGYSERFQGWLAEIADAEQESVCPAVTLEEAATIQLESAVLAQTPGIRAALEVLTHHLMRGVVVHESRHVADADQANAFERPMRCTGCPNGAVVRAEVSAYLASFADEATGYSSLHQACRVHRQENVNAIALGYLLPLLLPNGCAGGPPGDLQLRAQALEEQLLGRSHLVRFKLRAPAGHSVAAIP